MKALALVAFLLFSSSIHAADAAKKAEPKARAFQFRLALQDKGAGKFKVEFRSREARPGVGPLVTLEDLVPSTEKVTLPDMPDGRYTVYFHSPGYATQWRALTLEASTKEPVELEMTLARKLYAVVRYAFNASGAREFAAGQTERRVAVAAGRGLPLFEQDWRLLQRVPPPANSRIISSNALTLSFHRQTTNFGFAVAPKGATFENLKEAPEAGYRCRDRLAEKGLLLFCRVNGNKKEGLGYGKILIEEITEKPPDGIVVIERQ